MKASRPSRTAQFVALARALADLGLSHIPGFRDPTARVFLSDRGKKSLAKVEEQLRKGDRSMRVESARTMADMLGLRTTRIDNAVREAIAAGTRQLVILGAGYDGRAWRLSELTGVKVFEVDHPATQGDKRARVAELPPPAGIVSFVPIDFERESIDAVLERAGHDRSAPTCWIWEGVVMYLTRDAMHSTLRDISRRSAPGSTLIVNYHTAHRRFFARIIFRLIGEPQISAWSPEEMAADLKSVGFRVQDDSGMLDWNDRFANGEAKVQRAPYMRIVVASLLVLLMAFTGCATLPRRDGLQDAHLERLYFGRNIGDTAVVSDSAWTTFVHDVITPTFPEGATVWDAAGQWRAPDGKVVREKSFVVELLHLVTPDVERRVQTVMAEYKRRFAQQSVLRMVTNVRASF